MNTSTAAEPLLEVTGLSVDYGFGEAAVHAVRGADLTLHRGEVFGLAGESGSGKSTLAYAIARLLRMPGVITGGQVLFRLGGAGGAGSAGRAGSAGSAGRAGGAEIDLLAAGEAQLRELRWNQLAVVLQSAMNALNPVMTIGTQLTDVLQAHRRDLDRAGRRARAGELLGMVGIPSGRLASFPHELSGGMRQRVMIAMALALSPQLLIMDEPTTALDVVTQREILDELMGLRAEFGFAVLFITHDLSLLAEIADTIAVMYAGRIVESAPASQLYRAPRHPYSYGLLNSFPGLHGPRQRMTGIAGSPPDLRQLPAGCVFRPRCAHAFDRCAAESPELRAPERRQPGAAAAGLVACWLHDGAGLAPAELTEASISEGSVS